VEAVEDGGIATDVGMMASGEPAVRALDRVARCAGGKLQQLQRLLAGQRLGHGTALAWVDGDRPG
jgi:hypothetical protein